MITLIPNSRSAKIMDDSLRQLGYTNLFFKVTEECSELSQSCMKYCNDSDNPELLTKLTEECADVIVMVTALRRLLGEEQVDKIVREKLMRLEERLKETLTILPPVAERNLCE